MLIIEQGKRLLIDYSKTARDCLLYTKKGTNRVLFALLLPPA